MPEVWEPLDQWKDLVAVVTFRAVGLGAARSRAWQLRDIWKEK